MAGKTSTTDGRWITVNGTHINKALKKVKSSDFNDDGYTYEQSEKDGWKENVGPNKNLTYKGTIVRNGGDKGKFAASFGGKIVYANSFREMKYKLDIANKVTELYNSQVRKK